MADQRAQSNGDGNGDNGDSKQVYDDMPRYELVDLLIKEMGNVVYEANEKLREDLGGRIDKIGHRIGNLESDMNGLKSEMGVLRMEVHQNQTTFIKNHEGLDKRVEVLEGQAA